MSVRGAWSTLLAAPLLAILLGILVGLAALVGLLVLLQAYVFPGMIPPYP